VKIIVAVSKNWGIGYQNRLLFSLKEDMRFFRETTMGATVVMGLNTFKSLPNQKPLKNRKNIVLCGGGFDHDICPDGLILAHNLSELAAILKEETDELYVIGGASVYRLMLLYCEEALVTKVDAVVEADCFFEDLDKLDNWECVKESDVIEDSGYKIKFTTYKNTNVKDFRG